MPRVRESVATEEWTCRLLDRGFGFDDVVAIRGLDRAAVIRHLGLAARQGRSISFASVVDAATLQVWDDWRARHEAGTPPDLSPEMADLWPVFVAARRGQG